MLDNNDSPPIQPSSQQQQQQQQHVKFAHVQIRDYKQIVGDHPDCSYGPPISIGWEYKEIGTLSVDDYEASRGNFRPTANILHMSELRREAILKHNVGASDKEIQDAIYQVKKIQRQREETIDREFPREDKRSLGQKFRVAFSRLRKPVNYF